MDRLVIEDIDFTHIRLMDLSRLADQAKPFYDWVEKQFQRILASDLSLNELLQTRPKDDIRTAITACYHPKNIAGIPFLFDGIGRTYSHQKACYYFFAWIIRDAPQQRLSPLIQRVTRLSQNPRQTVEIEVLASLIEKYRGYVKTFAWDAIREVIIDRLEGSRRSLKGHEKETFVRTAVLSAIQDYFGQYGNYGIYAGITILDKQVVVGNETYDVCVHLQDEQNHLQRRIFVAIKTRETEGGGHAHLFSRDILSAIHTMREQAANDFLMVVIIAKNWSSRELERLNHIVDYLIVLDTYADDTLVMEDSQQTQLNNFIAEILNNRLVPKTI